MIECVVLDLDQTLVNSSALQEARDKKNWHYIEHDLHKTACFAGVQSFLRQMRQYQVKLAIVSNAPRAYVDSLLAYHNIDVDLVIGYGDMPRAKPDHSWFGLVSRYFRLNKQQVVFVGNDEVDRLAAVGADVRFVGVPWGSYTTSVETSDFSGLSNLIIKHDFLSEYQPKQEGYHTFLGYYCSGNKSDEVRKKLLAFKNNESDVMQLWRNALTFAINLPKADLVLRSLGHKEQYAQYQPLDFIGELIATQINAQYHPCLLSKKPSKKMSTCQREERKLNIAGTYDVLDKNAIKNIDSILIIDDVCTTGTTFKEISKTLQAVNPKLEIHTFSLVKTSHYGTSLQEISSLNERLKSIWRYGLTYQGRAPNTKVKKTFNASYTGHIESFVIQNLEPINKVLQSEELLTAVGLMKNILQRGLPTIASKYLRNTLGECGSPDEILGLVSNQPLRWHFEGEDDDPIRAQRSIGVKNLLSLLADNLPEWDVFQYLWQPFVSISETGLNISPYFINKQIDLFIPDLFLAIQISNHFAYHNDIFERDLASHGYQVIHFSLDELQVPNLDTKAKIAMISARYKHLLVIEKASSLSSYRVMPSDFACIQPAVNYHEVIRLQLAFLECLGRGMIDLSQPLQIEIKGYAQEIAYQAAIEDLRQWLMHLLILRNVTLIWPQINLIKVECFSKPKSNFLFFDIDGFARYSNQSLYQPNIIFIRNAHVQRQMTSMQVDQTSSELTYFETELIDTFEFEAKEPIQYQFHDNTKDYLSSLNFLLVNLFFPYQDGISFREGQREIVMSCLSYRHTLGLLPTGSGKSVCYQLAAVLQPALSFVVCPIKALMYDQKLDLDAIGFTRTQFITSDQSPEEKEIVQRNFAQGKYLFVFISPERFQTQKFRDELVQINLSKAFAYAVIDEVHCVSEWGHDFRTSYLNLARTINKFCGGIRYIGLTATASINVLQDVQNEFNVDEAQIKTPSTFGREELHFSVYNDGKDKYRALINLLHERNRKYQIFDAPSENGIVFTPHVNGRLGCYNLANNLSEEFAADIRFFSGSAPSYWPKNLKFDDFKLDVQRDFKKDTFKLLTATKAFGMGVNKGNVSYTVHYGIPSSMEALYQEAGRAGRDKNLYQERKADCIVLFGEEPNIKALDQLWEPNSSVAKLTELYKHCYVRSDISTNLSMFLNSTQTVKDELELMMIIFHQVDSYKTSSVIPIKTEKVRELSSQPEAHVTKSRVELAIFRLTQLGILTDWVVDNFWKGNFRVTIGQVMPEQIRETLSRTINRYDHDFSFAGLSKHPSENMRFLAARFERNQRQEEFYMSVLLLWSYEHFAYSRKQSLKTVYEHCYNLASGHITNQQFKIALESYFRFSRESDKLRDIAEDQLNYHLWFSVFYNNDGKLLSFDKLKVLQEQLSRFLESYRNNVGLDFISGVLRLIFDDFDDADGRIRYHAALNRVATLSGDQQYDILKALCKLFVLFESSQRKTIVAETSEILSDPRLLLVFNRELEPNSATNNILTINLQRLERLNKSLKK